MGKFQEVTKESENIKDIIGYIKEVNDDYKDGLLFTLDNVYLEKFETIRENLNEETFIEARFFDEEKELFIFYDGEKYKVVKTEKKEYKNYIIDEGKKENKEEVLEENMDSFYKYYYLSRKYFLDKNKFNNKNLVVKEFVAYDDDGQAYVKASCLDKLIVGDYNEK